MILSRSAPGVLANDNAAVTATARLVSPPRFGDLALAPDGGFTYKPGYRFAGHDYFSYQVVDGERVSAPVPVTIGFPNVIVILVDDLGLGHIGAYNPRAPVPTPNIDALADAGMAFDQAHSSAAVCSPTRYSILTGNHPYRGRLSSGVWNSYDFATMLLPGQTTLGHTFSVAGYRTAFVGKLHNGGKFWNSSGTGYTINPAEIDFSRPFDGGPTQFGFDYSFLLPGGFSGDPYAYFENDRLVRFDEASGNYLHFDTDAEARTYFVELEKEWGNLHNSGLLGAPGLAIDNFDSANSGRVLTRRALAFIEDAVAENTNNVYPAPFFLFYAAPELHTPNSPPRYFDTHFSNDVAQPDSGTPVAGTSGLGADMDMLKEIDLMVGALTDALEASGQLENTLIILTSDNGPLSPPHHQAFVPQGTDGGVPLRGYKGEIHEGGHRVPLLARWGGSDNMEPSIKPGSRSMALIGLHDLAATFYALFGMQRPEAQANDSKSFLPVLLGHDAVSPRDHLIVQGSPKSAAENDFYMDRAYYSRDADGNLWKLTVVSSNSDPLAELQWSALFNLKADPGETTNLISDPDYQARFVAMKSEYLALIVRSRTIDSFR